MITETIKEHFFFISFLPDFVQNNNKKVCVPAQKIQCKRLHNSFFVFSHKKFVFIPKYYYICNIEK